MVRHREWGSILQYCDQISLVSLYLLAVTFLAFSPNFSVFLTQVGWALVK